jgi:hypothetical protein
VDFSQAIEFFGSPGSDFRFKNTRMVYANRGIANYFLGNYSECLEDLTAAIDLGLSENSQVYDYRSTAFFLSRNFARAIKDRQVREFFFFWIFLFSRVGIFALKFFARTFFFGFSDEDFCLEIFFCAFFFLAEFWFFLFTGKLSCPY